MKKILLLGGSAQQIVAIETAKRLGLYTVLCDYLVDNPGQYLVDKFYLVSTTDREAVLKVAKDEKVDAVLAYASDPAAPAAAYVADVLGLPGNPYEITDTLCNKDKFRVFLKENGFCVPKAKGYSNYDEAVTDVLNGYFDFPVIVKPVDSAGSKGVSVVNSMDKIREAIDFAFSFSKNKRIIIEKFIERKHEYTVGGDIVVLDGKVVIWGLMNCFRAHSINPLVPGGKIYPLILGANDIDNIKKTLQNMVTKLGFRNGCMNIELVIDRNNDVYLIDVGPRAGGNMIPIQLSCIFDVDIVEFLVKCAIGEKVTIDPDVKIPYCSTYVLHSDKCGEFKGVTFSQEIDKFIFKKNIYKKVGEYVEEFSNAGKAVGIIFMSFPDMDEMIYKMNHMDEYIKINLE